MNTTVRHLLELIQDCENGDEARLLLRACGYELSIHGAVRGLKGETFHPLSKNVFCGPDIRCRYVFYGDIKCILRISGRRDD